MTDKLIAIRLSTALGTELKDLQAHFDRADKALQSLPDDGDLTADTVYALSRIVVDGLDMMRGLDAIIDSLAEFRI